MDFYGLEAMLAPMVAWMKANQDLSGWAQFFGGVLTVLAAYSIGRSQQRAAERMARRAEADRLQILLELSAIVMATNGDFRDRYAAKRLPPTDFKSERWDEAVDRFSRVDPMVFSTPLMAVRILNAPWRLKLLKESYLRFVEKAGGPGQDVAREKFETDLFAAEQTLSDLYGVCDEERGKLLGIWGTFVDRIRRGRRVRAMLLKGR